MSILDQLNPEQRQVVENYKGPIMVIAGPGSGKTRALTHKIAYLINEQGVYPDEILAVTFTNKAAAEMKERIGSLLNDSTYDLGFETEFGNIKINKAPTWIGTFHSICARILRVDGKYIDIENNFVIYDTDDSVKLIKDIILDLNMNPKDINAHSINSLISRAKGEMVGPEEFSNQASGSYFYEKAAQIYTLYQKKLRDNNALDFSDLLYETVNLFKANKEVLHKYQDQFKYILVDEYQDTNRVQYYIVNLLAHKHKNITVVGDISQSIYSWRGADYRNMSQFEKDYPDAQTFHLAKNYRSTENIINAAKEVIQNNSTHIPIDLYTENEPGENILLYEAADEKSEARYITDTIGIFASIDKDGNVLQENDYSRFAILYRTNAQSRSIEEAFLNAGIPYRIIGGMRFYDRKEIKDAIAYLRVFKNPKDSVSWARCINTPPRKIGKKTYQKIILSDFDLDLINELTKKDWKKYIELAQQESTQPLELLDAVLKEFGYLKYLDDGTEESLSRIENLKELRSVANQYDSIDLFLENVALVESSNRARLTDDNSVVLMTMHAAKGLEFDTVFIAGMEEGLFPHSRSMADESELEEERRLCYVGITRAKKKVHLTYTRQRTYFGSTSSTIISRFIAEIPEEIIEYRFS